MKLKLGNFAIVCLMMLSLAGCSEDDVSTESGGGSAVVGTGCTGAQIAGQWEVSANAFLFSRTETVTFDGSEILEQNAFSGTFDGITLNGSINAECNAGSGTFTDGGTGISGRWTATKLS